MERPRWLTTPVVIALALIVAGLLILLLVGCTTQSALRTKRDNLVAPLPPTALADTRVWFPVPDYVAPEPEPARPTSIIVTKILRVVPNPHGSGAQ